MNGLLGMAMLLQAMVIIDRTAVIRIIITQTIMDLQRIIPTLPIAIIQPTTQHRIHQRISSITPMILQPMVILQRVFFITIQRTITAERFI